MQKSVKSFSTHNSSLYDNKLHKSPGVLFLYGVNMCYEKFLTIFLRTALMKEKKKNSFNEISFTHCKIHPWKVQNSVVSNIFTGLCNHHHCLVRTFSSLRKETPIGVILPFPFPPVLPQSTSSLHDSAYSRHFLQMESYNVFFCTEMFIAVLLIIVAKWKQLKCPSTDQRINKRRYVHTIEYSLAIERTKYWYIMQQGWTLKKLCLLRKVRHKKMQTVFPAILHFSVQ